MTPARTAGGAFGWLRSVTWSSYVVYIGFVLVFAYFSITQAKYFPTPSNLMNIVVQTAPITIMAIGAVFVLSTSEIDLSIGSTVALSSLVAAITLQASGL
ncbi:MAG: hypothetical protein QM607_10080 [Microbacterium sp.]